MFVGHLAAGFAIKARIREAPLGPVLAGTALLDLLFAVFVMIGLDRVVVHDPPVFANWELHVGYSHSLLVSVIYGVVLGWLAARRWRAAAVGVAIGLAIFSHFVLDVLTHRPDMPLIGVGARRDVLLGTGLATHPLAFFVVELGWCLLAWRWYDGRNRRLLITFLVLMAVWANNIFGFSPLPVLSSVGQGALTFVSFALAAAVLWWAARPTELRASQATP